MQYTNETYYDPVTKIWSSRQRKEFYGADMTLGEVILHSLSKTPHKVIQVMDTTGEELTAEQLIKDCKKMATKIQKLGLQIGDVVGINATNTTNLTAAVVGALLCGTPTHAVFPDFDKETIKFIYGVSQPKLIFCDVETYDTTKAVADELELDLIIITVNGKIKNVESVNDILMNIDYDLNDDKFPCNKMTGDDTAVILCSSGTTGTPKGVLNSHQMILNRPIFYYLPSDAVTFSFSTLYWASGLWTLLISLVHGVKRIITTKPYTPEYFIELIEKYCITHMITTPHQWAPFIKKSDKDLQPRLASLNTVICGGSKVSKLISEPLNKLLRNSINGFVVGYGMSEISAISRNEINHRREGTEGKLEPNTEVRIVGTEGQYLGPNEEGILHVHTPFKWSGYYRNPEATQNSYVNGWLITGDIGYFDDDGFLNLCTRNNDVFKCNNFQIYPELIEEVIMQVPGVNEVCVFGIPDFATGNLPACAVVRENDKDGKKLNSAYIFEHVQQKMASAYHLKGGVHFVDELPKTGSGKIIRRQVINLIKFK